MTTVERSKAARLLKQCDIRAGSTRVQARRLSAERHVSARWLVYDQDPKERAKRKHDADKQHLCDMIKAVRETKIVVWPGSAAMR